MKQQWRWFSFSLQNWECPTRGSVVEGLCAQFAQPLRQHTHCSVHTSAKHEHELNRMPLAPRSDVYGSTVGMMHSGPNQVRQQRLGACVGVEYYLNDSV